jgi:hypothetical protein
MKASGSQKLIRKNPMKQLNYANTLLAHIDPSVSVYVHPM